MSLSMSAAGDGVLDGGVPIIVDVGVLVVPDIPPVGEGFTIVVLFSVLVLGEAAVGSTVSVFCSHAAKSAAPARMQMYFFIYGGWPDLGQS